MGGGICARSTTVAWIDAWNAGKQRLLIWVSRQTTLNERVQKAATAQITRWGAKHAEVHHMPWRGVVVTVAIRMDGLKAANGPEASHSPNQQKGGPTRGSAPYGMEGPGGALVIRMDGLKAANGPEASHSPNQWRGGPHRVVALWSTMGR